MPKFPGNSIGHPSKKKKEGQSKRVYIEPKKNCTWSRSSRKRFHLMHQNSFVSLIFHQICNVHSPFTGHSASVTVNNGHIWYIGTQNGFEAIRILI